MRRRSLCAFEDPNSTPSGTMTAARPLGFNNFRNRAIKSSSVLLVLTTRCRSFDVDSQSSEPANGGLAGINVYFSVSSLAPRRKRVAIANIRRFDAVHQHVHAGNSKHRVVEVVPVKHAGVEVLTLHSVSQYRRMLLADVLRRGYKEASGADAGSQISSVGFGAIMSTINLMMCRSMRN